MLRLVRALLVLPLLAACVGDAETARWGRGEALGQLVVQQVDRMSTGDTVSLRDLAPFRWERLHLFDPATSPETLRDSLGVEWVPVEPGGARAAGPSTLLVFSGGGEVLAATLLPRSLVEVAPELVGRGYAPHEATFRVDRDEGRRRLVR